MAIVPPINKITKANIAIFVNNEKRKGSCRRFFQLEEGPFSEIHNHWKPNPTDKNQKHDTNQKEIIMCER